MYYTAGFIASSTCYTGMAGLASLFVSVCGGGLFAKGRGNRGSIRRTPILISRMTDNQSEQACLVWEGHTTTVPKQSLEMTAHLSLPMLEGEWGILGSERPSRYANKL
jgi:hypothetical protein